MNLFAETSLHSV